jgi:Na+/proline symporter
LGKPLSEEHAVHYSRLSSVVVGLVSLLIALRPPAMILVLAAFAWAAIASTCLWPILFGIYWKGVTRWGVLASMVGGLTTSLVWMGLHSPFDVHGFIPGIAVGFILIVVLSRLTPKLPSEHLAHVWGRDEKARD